jgi:hypothetical protein
MLTNRSLSFTAQISSRDRLACCWLAQYLAECQVDSKQFLGRDGVMAAFPSCVRSHSG